MASIQEYVLRKAHEHLTLACKYARQHGDNVTIGLIEASKERAEVVLEREITLYLLPNIAGLPRKKLPATRSHEKDSQDR